VQGSALFSEAFGVTHSEGDTWFDPLLTTDTQLWIDPFLLDSCEAAEFEGASADVYEHFRSLFLILARDPQAQIGQYLIFPEAPEIGLGYTSRGTEGSGSGSYLAGKIRQAMAKAIAHGLGEPRHFEEIGLLSPGIAQDRISDITTRLIMHRLGAYTERVCTYLEIPTEPFRLWGYVQADGKPKRTLHRGGAHYAPLPALSHAP
jgi:hypothetical protein